MKTTERMSKSDFIRQHPNRTPAEIVKLAASTGVVIGAGHVYNVRAYDKAHPVKRGPGRPPKSTTITTPAAFFESRARANEASAPVIPLDVALVDLVIAHGVEPIARKGGRTASADRGLKKNAAPRWWSRAPR